ncbi:MAG: DUF3791 domain-containing protein [Clostridia bacterium]|nr:DUF3791 domain-containing protein [Clostridia bacterium]
MSELTRKTVNYTVACVNEFARRKQIHPRTAFFYLYQYQGLKFLEEFYEVEHTLSIEDALDDLENICHQNGGRLQ